MNRYEENYLDNYDLRVSLMEKMRTELPCHHKCYRDSPCMESRIMFDKFVKSPLITETLDITSINTACIGNFINHPTLHIYNRINISGPASLVTAFMNKTSKVNIFINAVKPIPGTHSLWNKEFVILKQLTTATTKTYKSLEQPFTQQYCNWYEFFERLYGPTYDYRHFIVIITTEAMLDAYREVYPHFLICTQAPGEIRGLGFTRYTGLTLAYHLQLTRIIQMDDNIVDLLIYHGEGCTAETLCPINVIEQLFIERSFNGIGLVEFNRGAPIGNRHYERFLRDNHYVTDGELKLTTTIEPSAIPTRTYTAKPVDLTNITWSGCEETSVPNPHRPKIVLINTELLWHYRINYQLSLFIGEDINFTRSVLLHKLPITVLNITYVDPYDDRRPRLEIFQSTERTKYNEITYNRFLSKEEIILLNKKYFIETMADMIMFNGNVIYCDDQGVYAGSGVYGPYRIITRQDQQTITSFIGEKYKLSRYIKIGYLGLPNNYQAYYVRTNKFNYHLNNVDRKWRFNNIYQYLLTTESINSIVETDKFKSTVKYISKFINSYDLVCAVDSLPCNTDDSCESIKSPSQHKILQPGTGMVKYSLQYEYLDHRLQVFFSFFTKTTIFLPYIQTTYKMIIEQKNEVIDYLLMDDLIFYLEHYSVAPARIYKILSLLVLYVKFNALKFIIHKNIELDLAGYHRFIFIYTNLNHGLYQFYQVTDRINDLIVMILNAAVRKDDFYKITLTATIIEPLIDNIYQTILEKN